MTDERQSATELGVGELHLQPLDFPRRHERRELAEATDHGVDRRGVFVRHLLGVPFRLP
jgi:hypothetical protein